VTDCNGNGVFHILALCSNLPALHHLLSHHIVRLRFDLFQINANGRDWWQEAEYHAQEQPANDDAQAFAIAARRVKRE
jgi:hypothetical protein